MKYFYLILGLVILLASSSTFGKFPPDELTNLKVLPKDISFPELMTNMKGFTQALGVRCEHCHVSEPETGYCNWMNPMVAQNAYCRS
jgi:thioredoxin reductase